MRIQNAGFWGGIAVLIYSAVIFAQSLSLNYYTEFGPGPGFFPLWLSGILIILSIGLILGSIKKEKIFFKDILPKGRSLMRVVLVPASLIVFILIVNFTGFIIASSVLLFLVFILEFKWYMSLALSSSISILLFFIFQSILEVPLPVNVLGW
ncbi:tripartite tricarboxylate transporter TctB family protein [Neobacillus sp. 3P2-tot-E-2]|uniref:tripartite tricarboxylate transporter TctB family protein n=1 Tax=Neobacillus sp. 3P2-tot-E-2 TaxID=3132212 RepID=UPI00399FFCBB